MAAVPILHVALHLALCNAIARKAAGAPVAIHVRLVDSDKRSEFDKVFNVVRGYDDTRVLEFDTERGVYHLLVDVPKFNCSANDYAAFLPDIDRNTIAETLVPGKVPDPHPMLVNGSMPQSFQGQEPTFVFFDKRTTGCNKPVGDILPGTVHVDYDQTAYYAAVLPDAALDAHRPVYMALRLRTPQKEYHYIRVPDLHANTPYPLSWQGWPHEIRFNLPEDEFTSVAHDPVDTLLCPKFTKITVG
ncbi:MAG: hypothetical protein NVS9B12_05580 [Vulcanimicrobiaceae bacterium]